MSDGSILGGALVEVLFVDVVLSVDVVLGTLPRVITKSRPTFAPQKIAYAEIKPKTI
jgi:hypothetical protein